MQPKTISKPTLPAKPASPSSNSVSSLQAAAQANEVAAFDSLLQDLKRLAAERSFKSRLLSQLSYFREQASQHPSERHADTLLRTRWTMLEQQADRAGVLAQLEANPAWTIAKHFCGSFQSSVKKSTAAKTLPKAESAAGEEMNESRFFQTLMLDLDHRKNGNSPKSGEPPIDPKDHWLLYLGLRTLFVEASKSAGERDQQVLLPTWKMLWPLLNQYGLLNDYSRDLALRDKVRLFISGNFDLKSSQTLSRGKRRSHPGHDYTGRQGVTPSRLPERELAADETKLKTHCPPTARQTRTELKK